MALPELTGLELNELKFITELNDNDLLLVENVSQGLPLCKIRLTTLRSSFIGGWPSLEDVPEGVVTPPNWTVRGVEGGWIIRIGRNVIEGTEWYFIYKLNVATGEYDVVHALAENRDPDPYEKKALTYEHFLEETDTPSRDYGTFKVQSVSQEYQGALSDAQSAWTRYDLPSDWIPDAPTLLTAGSYPLTSYSLLPDGGLGYTISLKIEAPADQKNLIKEYNICRVCDEGTDSFDGQPPKVNTLTINAAPGPKVVLWHDTDRSFVPGYKYRYWVLARGLSPNNNLGPISNTQDVTLADDTTAPDDPTFTVETSSGGIEVTFDPILVGGNPDVGWSHILLQFRIDDGDWNEIKLEKTNFYAFPVSAENYEDEYDFRAKVVDYAGNENAGGWVEDFGSYTGGEVTELMFGTELYNKIVKIEINEGNITTNSSAISQNATDINLRVEKDDVIAQINVSSEVILIAAENIEISGSTTFSAGYNPTEKTFTFIQAAIPTSVAIGDTWIRDSEDNRLYRAAIAGANEIKAGEWIAVADENKLNKLAGQYASDSSGARVLIFPSATIGLQIIDDAAGDVLKVMVGGAGVTAADPGIGDLVIGDGSGEHIWWNKDQGELFFAATMEITNNINLRNGAYTVGYLGKEGTGATLGGKIHLRTQASNEYIDMGASHLTFFQDHAGYPVSQRVSLEVAAANVTLDMRSGEGTGNRFLLLDKDSLDLQNGCDLEIDGTAVITDAKVLQNVTANASIITAGQFNTARLPDIIDIATSYKIGTVEVLTAAALTITSGAVIGPSGSSVGIGPFGGGDAHVEMLSQGAGAAVKMTTVTLSGDKMGVMFVDDPDDYNSTGFDHLTYFFAWNALIGADTPFAIPESTNMSGGSATFSEDRGHISWDRANTRLVVHDETNEVDYYFASSSNAAW